jgi:hypothetical protein
VPPCLSSFLNTIGKERKSNLKKRKKRRRKERKRKKDS